MSRTMPIMFHHGWIFNQDEPLRPYQVDVMMISEREGRSLRLQSLADKFSLAGISLTQLLTG